MDDLIEVQKNILAIKIVVQNMIVAMGEEEQDLLRKLTTAMTDELISKSTDLAPHFEDIKESAMEMINMGTFKPEEND